MKPRINEHDEFLLSRLLDGDLSTAEAEVLRRRLENEPGLSEAYAAMARLDGLLKGRRADQPQLDWKAFHARVVDQVKRGGETRAAAPVIRLSRWLAIGLPLAAAATIALFLLFSGAGNSPIPGGGGPKGPGAPPSGNLVVTIEKPKAAPPTSPEPIRVNFKRSQQLAEAIWQEDAIREEKPHMGLAGGPSLVPEAAPEQKELDLLVDFLPM